MTLLDRETSCRESALFYADHGWYVIPIHVARNGKCSCGKADCASPGKHPRTMNGLTDATRDPIKIGTWWTRWPDANVGIVTGAQSGIIVIDVDPDNGGEVTLAGLMNENGELPETVEAETGGSGLHLIFAHPGGMIRNTAGKIGAGVDTRGDGGYIVAAPSLHASGKRYTWKPQAAPGESQLAAMPAWILKVLQETPAPQTSRERLPDDSERFWLGKALAKCNPGNRNDTGFWLACQLRDAGVPEGRAQTVLREYAQRTPHGKTPYTDREAIATTTSAYHEARRTPARGEAVPVSRRAAKPDTPTNGAANELRTYLRDVVEGRVYNVPMPWPVLTKFTNALLPGSTCTICGDPGVGKTFLVLDCLQHWHANGFSPAVFFIEKNRRFHTHRLLAQLEGDGHYVNYEWLKEHGAEVDAAMARNSGLIDELGLCIHSAPPERVTLGSLLIWIREMATAGKRVILIDPITAADAGKERWTVDDDFMIAAQNMMAEHGASLVLITHPKKGNRNGTQTGHDQSGGAAYHRFADTNIWLHKPKKPKRVRVYTKLGPCNMTLNIFAQMHKTRNGKGAGSEIGFIFGEGLRFSEQGFVLGDAKEDPQGGVE